MNPQTAVKGELRQYVESQSTPSQHDTIGAKIRHYAEMQPERPALVSSGFAPLSYGDLQYQIDTVRSALRSAGLGRRARIVIAIPNGPQAALAIVAVSCSAVSVPVNPRQTLSELERCLATVRPDAILLIKDDNSVARQAAEATGVTIIEAVQTNAGLLGFDIQGAPTAEIPLDDIELSDPDALAFIFQTSGTSAEPKLIPFSHGNMLAAAARLQSWYNLTSQDCCLSVTPLFYSHGLKVTVFTPLLSGGTVAFPTDASKFDYLEWFGRLKPTWYSAGPTLHRLVFDQVKSGVGTNAGNSLRFVVSGGAPLPQDILDGLQHSLGVPVVEQYGTSEAAVVATNSPPPGRSKPGTCGLPWSDTVSVVGDGGGPLPPGERGEILLRGPTLISGYLNAPEFNGASFVDGWFSTGDIGSLDADGFLTIHGRKTEFINRGGEKIAPVEVDQALMRHPAVADAAAFAIPHPRLGEDVAAAVVFRPGTSATPFELRRFLFDQISSFKVPRQIVVRNQLPKGTTGKILRRRLTESFQDEPAEGGQPVPPKMVDGKSIDFAIRLTPIWERLLKTAPISIDDDFFERGGDSLLAVNMLAELDELMGEAIPASVLLENPTIRQLAYSLSERRKSGPENLIRINPNGGQRPLVLFHGDYIWGGSHLSLELTRVLGLEQPVLVVAPHGGGEAFPESIEAMAAERLPLILAAQPEGPYRLCGYCIGGVVAFEAARLLLAAGKEVDMVFMLDSPTINARKSVQFLLSIPTLAQPLLGSAVNRAKGRTWHLFAEAQRIWNVSRTRKLNALKTRARKLVFSNRMKKNQAAASPLSGGYSSYASFSDTRTARYSTLMSGYNPKPLNARVIYISVDFGVGKWRRVSKTLEVIKSTGTHYLLNIPHIASVLSNYLYAAKK